MHRTDSRELRNIKIVPSLNYIILHREQLPQFKTWQISSVQIAITRSPTLLMQLLFILSEQKCF